MKRNDGRETAEPRERSAIAGVHKRHGRSAKDAARPWPGRAALLGKARGSAERTPAFPRPTLNSDREGARKRWFPRQRRNRYNR